MNNLQPRSMWNDKAAQLRKLDREEDCAFELSMRERRREDEKKARMRREEMEGREG